MRLGVVGLGKAGLRHARAAAANESIELVGLADAAAAARARAPEGPICVASLDELVGVGLEAVVIALPHAFLCQAALSCLDAGLHVLLEKPMANSLADARRIVELARVNERCLMVNYNHRFRDEYRNGKRLLEQGGLGRSRLFVEQMVAPAGPLPEWVWSPEIAGGGMMTYNGAHMIDHVLWLADQPVHEVWATMHSLHFAKQLEDTCTASLRFADGSLATLIQHKSDVAHRHGHWETRVFGTSGALRIVSGEGVSFSDEGGERSYPSSIERRFDEALAEFALAIEEHRSPRPDGDDGLRVMACLEAVYRSADQGRWVPVEEPAGG